MNHPPFCWRLLPPLLVWGSGLPAEFGFRLLTLTSLALFPAAVINLIVTLRASTTAALTMGAVAALAPPILGAAALSYAITDAFAVLLITVAVRATIAGRGPTFFVCVVALALTKETWTLPAVFALIWPWDHDRRFYRYAVPAIVVAGLLMIGVRVAIVESESYSLPALIRESHWPFDMRTMARRLLLATGATWGLLLPLAAATIIRQRSTLVGAAVAVPITLATGQILVASDTPRTVAAAYPFIMMAAALEWDRLPAPSRVPASVLLVVAQLPWLLTYAWVVRLPLRAAEIVIVLGTTGLIPLIWRRR